MLLHDTSRVSKGNSKTGTRHQLKGSCVDYMRLVVEEVASDLSAPRTDHISSLHQKPTTTFCQPPAIAHTIRHNGLHIRENEPYTHLYSSRVKVEDYKSASLTFLQPTPQQDYPSHYQPSLRLVEMLFNTQHFAILASISVFTSAFPLGAIAPRQKNYSVINVDGGNQPAQATTVIEATKTIEIISPGPEATSNAAPTPTPASSSPCSSSSSSSTPTTSSSASISKPVETPKPVFVTVTVPKDDGPTEYYDDGMWHTRYRIKSFGPAVVTPVASSSTIPSSTVSSALATSTSA